MHDLTENNITASPTTLELTHALLLTAAAVIGGMIVAIVLAFLLNPRVAAILTEIMTYFVPAVLVIRYSSLRHSGVYDGAIFRDIRLILLLPALGAASGAALGYTAELAHRIYPIPVTFAEAMFNLLSTNSLPEMIWVIIVAAVTPAIAEELLFRGILQPAMISKLGPRMGIFLCSLIFAVIHFNPWAFVALLIEGTLFGYLAYRTGTFWAGTLAHFGINCMAVIAAGTQETFDYAELTAGTSWYTFVIGFAGAILGIWAFLKITTPRDQRPDSGASFDAGSRMV